MLTVNHLPANQSRAHVILMLGAPGSGKGTQSSWLSGRLGIPCLSTGEILRTEAKRNTPAGFRLRAELASGALVEDSTVCEVVGAHLRTERPGTGLILDGFPRTVTQAEFLDGLLAELGLPSPTLIHLDISKEALLRRLTGRRQCAACGSVYNLLSRPSRRGSRCENDGGALVQRDDDTESVILHRLAEYEAYAASLIEYYQGPGYHRVAADRDPAVIGEELLSILGGSSCFGMSQSVGASSFSTAA